MGCFSSISDLNLLLCFVKLMLVFLDNIFLKEHIFSVVNWALYFYYWFRGRLESLQNFMIAKIF